MAELWNSIRLQSCRKLWIFIFLAAFSLIGFGIVSDTIPGMPQIYSRLGSGDRPCLMQIRNMSVPKAMNNSIYVNVDSERIQKRLAITKNVCMKYYNNGQLMNVKLDGDAWTYKQLVYCLVPKVGCTFWKQIFRFLNKDYRGNVSGPADIDRTYVHYGRLNQSNVFRLSNPIVRTLLSEKRTFMFTRDPYTRLWSGYIDKYFLPDFWRTRAKGIIKTLRPNANAYSKLCANDVTFEELLLNVISTSKRGVAMDRHFSPIYRLCSPCHIKFNYIGKQETFSADMKHILKQEGFDYLLENYTFDNHVQEELTMLIKYNLNLRNAMPRQCFRDIDVAQRLWKSFQINGYIPKASKFPMERFVNMSNNELESILTEVALQEYEKHKTSASEWKNQRLESLKEAYKSVPKTILEQIKDVFRFDFELFGYDPQPDYLFK